MATKQNWTPVISIAIISAVTLIIALAFIFRGDTNDTEPVPEEPETVTVDQKQTAPTDPLDAACDTEEMVANNPECQQNQADNCEGVVREGRCVEQTTCNGRVYDLKDDDSWIDEDGVRQTVCQTAGTQPLPSGLPGNWSELSAREKTDLNPLGCDTATQIIWAEDGTCHDKEVSDQNESRPLAVRYMDDIFANINQCEYGAYYDVTFSPGSPPDLLPTWQDNAPEELRELEIWYCPRRAVPTQAGVRYILDVAVVHESIIEAVRNHRLQTYCESYVESRVFLKPLGAPFRGEEIKVDDYYYLVGGRGFRDDAVQTILSYLDDRNIKYLHLPKLDLYCP